MSLGGILGALMKGGADQYLLDKHEEEERAVREREIKADQEFKERMVRLRATLDADAADRRFRHDSLLGEQSAQAQADLQEDRQAEAAAVREGEAQRAADKQEAINQANEESLMRRLEDGTFALPNTSKGDQGGVKPPSRSDIIKATKQAMRNLMAKDEFQDRYPNDAEISAEIERILSQQNQIISNVMRPGQGMVDKSMDNESFTPDEEAIISEAMQDNPGVSRSDIIKKLKEKRFL